MTSGVAHNDWLIAYMDHDDYDSSVAWSRCAQNGLHTCHLGSPLHTREMSVRGTPYGSDRDNQTGSFRTHALSIDYEPPPKGLFITRLHKIRE